MSKATAEQSNALSIFWLKKYGYLSKGGNWKWGGIKWTYGLSESNISFQIDTLEENYIRLIYTHTNHWADEKSEMNYKVKLTTSPCNYGGVRYWFVCPLSKNGQYCGRRVGVIYSIGQWFGCRHCGEIAYNSQMSGGKYRGSSVTAPDIDKAEKDVKRYYYKGGPTRKYRRLMRLNQKFDDSFILMAARLDKDFMRFANPKE